MHAAFVILVDLLDMLSDLTGNNIIIQTKKGLTDGDKFDL